jgi:hypothetical protein
MGGLACELARLAEVPRGVLGPWGSYTDALICPSLHRPSMQFIP